MSRYIRRGFTLLALMVAVTVFCFIFALVSYYVYYARIQSEQRICEHQICTVGLAMLSFEAKAGAYPGYLNSQRPGGSNQNAQTRGVSWVVKMRPYINYMAGVRGLHPTSGSGVSPNGFSQAQASLVCPSHRPAADAGSFLSYVVNAGCKDTQAVSTTLPRDWVENGVFFDHFSDDPSWNTTATAPLVHISNSYISGRDGTTQTLMLSENVDAGHSDDYAEELLGFTWDPTNSVDVSTPIPTVVPSCPEQCINVDAGGREREMRSLGYRPPSGGINVPTLLAHYARPSSNHRGGVNVVYCDGHTQFLSEDIEYYVYCMIMSPSTRQVKRPGDLEVLPNWLASFDDAWLCCCPESVEESPASEPTDVED